MWQNGLFVLGTLGAPTWVNITDLINRIVQILKQDLRQLRISTQDAELMEPVKP